MALPQIDIDGIKMLTEYKPAVNNLFSVYIFDSETGSGDTLSNYSPYHATGFTFGEETFDFKRHPVSKVMFLGSEGLKRVDEFSITWRESEDWRVKRYHEAWIGQFYNKEEDHFWSYPVNGNGSTPKLGKKFRIVFAYTQKNAAMNFNNGSFSPNTSIAASIKSSLSMKLVSKNSNISGSSSSISTNPNNNIAVLILS